MVENNDYEAMEAKPVDDERETKHKDQDADVVLFTYEKEFDDETNETAKGTVVTVPSDVYKNIKTFMEKINEVSTKAASSGGKVDMSKKDLAAIAVYAGGASETLDRGFYVKPINQSNREWVNKLIYGNKELVSHELALSSKATGNISGEAAIAKLYGAMGLGGYRQIPLWHSGIWVSLRTPTDAEMINLEYALAESEIALGRSTNELIYSNYDAIFTRIVTEFALDCIQTSTLKVTNKSDLLKYIKPQDKHALALGIIQVSYNKGFDIVRTCVNTGVIENGKPKCTNRVKALINPSNMLRVDRSQLTAEHLKHMSKRTPDSTDVDDVLEYQRTLEANRPEVVSINNEYGERVISVEFSMPSLLDTITSGEEWVQNVISASQKMFTEDMTPEVRNMHVEQRSKAVLQTVYSHFVSKITYDDGTTVTDRDTINKLLLAMGHNKTIYTNIMEETMRYIDKHVMAIVAIQNYVCPACKQEQTTGGSGPFKEFIPVNPFAVFFDLSAFRVEEIMLRTTGVN